MEEIYVNVEYIKSVDSTPPTNQTGPRSSERRFHGAVVLCLGLLSVFLLAGLIGLGVHYSDVNHGLTEERDLLNANLTETTEELHRLQSLSKQNSDVIRGLTEERDLLNINLTETTQELHRLQSLSKQNSDVVRGLTEERDLLNAKLSETTKKLHRLQCLSMQNQTCPAGWKMFSCSCYRLSSERGSWSTGRQDCRERGADLVVINSLEEQKFFSTFTEKETMSWIGLTDRDTEGTWKWIDGTLLTLSYWGTNQPDNGAGTYGEEDCAHFYTGSKTLNNWNDLPCRVYLQWTCEKNADV
ncbi:CD209 antigen-like protein C [Scomber scombrus]|uniref:CD209 antigen-like protein C n=1 Tax=Scomber scombrus TaxID=13677 RepID=UPI002DDBC6D6|nr:CD209 antigen-like protein C [Scomber scombrus]